MTSHTSNNDTVIFYDCTLEKPPYDERLVVILKNGDVKSNVAYIKVPSRDGGCFYAFNTNIEYNDRDDPRDSGFYAVRGVPLYTPVIKWALYKNLQEVY